jgi:hypothetical protein
MCYLRMRIKNVYVHIYIIHVKKRKKERLPGRDRHTTFLKKKRGKKNRDYQGEIGVPP